MTGIHISLFWRLGSENWAQYQGKWASQVALVAKKLPASAGDIRDLSLIPGSGSSSGEGNGNPLQYSCLENTMDRGAWWAAVHGVTQSCTWLKRFSIHASRHLAESLSAESSLSGSRTAVFSPCPQVAREFLGNPFYKGTNPIHGGSTLMTSSPPIGPHLLI